MYKLFDCLNDTFIRGISRIFNRKKLFKFSNWLLTAIDFKSKLSLISTNQHPMNRAIKNHIQKIYIYFPFSRRQKKKISHQLKIHQVDFFPVQ